MDDSVEEKQEQSAKLLWVWACIYLSCILFGSVLLWLLALLITLPRSEYNLGHGLLSNQSNVRIFNITYVPQDTNINNNNFTFNDFSLLAREFENSIGSMPRGTIDVINSDEQNVSVSNDHRQQRLIICDTGITTSGIEYIFNILVRYPTQYICQSDICAESFFSLVHKKLETMEAVSLKSDNGVIAPMSLCSIGKTSILNNSRPSISNETTYTALPGTAVFFSSTTATNAETLIQTNATTVTQTTLNNSPTNTTSIVIENPFTTNNIDIATTKTAPTSTGTPVQNSSITTTLTVLNNSPTNATTVAIETSSTTNNIDIAPTNTTATSTSTSIQTNPTTTTQTALNNNPTNTTTVVIGTSFTTNNIDIATTNTTPTNTVTPVQTSATTTTQTALNSSPSNTTTAVLGTPSMANNIVTATTNTTVPSIATPIQTDPTTTAQTALNNNPSSTTTVVIGTSSTIKNIDIATTNMTVPSIATPIQTDPTTTTQTALNNNPTNTTTVVIGTSFTTNNIDIAPTNTTATSTSTSIQTNPTTTTQTALNNNPANTTAVAIGTSSTTNNIVVATTDTTATSIATVVQTSPTTTEQTLLNKNPTSTTIVVIGTSSTTKNIDIAATNTAPTSIVTPVQTSTTTAAQTALNNSTTTVVIGTSFTTKNIDIATASTTASSTSTSAQTSPTTTIQTVLNNSPTKTTSIVIGTSSTTSETLSTRAVENITTTTVAQTRTSSETAPTKLVSTEPSVSSSASTSTQMKTTTSPGTTTTTAIVTSTQVSLQTTTSGSVQYLYALPNTVKAIWNTVAGGNSLFATAQALGMGTYPSDEPPDNLFDNLNNTEYSNRGNSFIGSTAIAGLNTGFFVTVGPCPSVLEGFIIQTGNENSSNDPLKITTEGSNSSINLNIGTSWKSIYNNATGLNTDPGRQTDGAYQTVNNTKAYTNYRFLVTSKRGNQSDYVSYGEVKLYGHYIYSAIPVSGSPSLLSVLSSSVQPVWNTTVGKDSLAATAGNVGYGTYISGNSATNLFDNSTKTRHISRGNVYSGKSTYAGLNTGFYVTVAHCQAILTGFSFFADITTSDRDPTNITIEGSNVGDLTKGANWHLLYSGSTGLRLTNRTNEGDLQVVNNTISYLSYRFLVTDRRSASNDYVGYAEVRLYGYHA